MSKPNILVGKTLTGVQIAEDKEAIRFLTTEGEVIARCDADCCSRTWVEHIELPARGLPAVVLSADEIELNGDKDDQYGELKFYGFKIVTNNGDLIVDYRNESNGYYGGSLSWPGEYFYGGVYEQNISKEEWREVTP